MNVGLDVVAALACAFAMFTYLHEYHAKVFLKMAAYCAAIFLLLDLWIYLGLFLIKQWRAM